MLGVSFVNFSLPDMPETTTMEPDGTGQMVDAGDSAIGLVYAYQLTDKLSAAASLRFVQSTLGPETLSAVSVNVSSLMYTGFQSLRIGMNMKNLGGEQEIVSEKSEMPLVFHTGIAMELYGNLGDPVSLTGSFEGAFFTDREQRWNSAVNSGYRTSSRFERVIRSNTTWKPGVLAVASRGNSADDTSP